MIRRMTYSAMLMFGVCATIYIGLYATVPNEILITLLNSFFIASGVAVATSYAPTFCNLMFRRRQYDRITHYAIGMFCAWLALYLLVANSIYIRATIDIVQIHNNDFLASTGRFVAIFGAIFQVTSPDLGREILYGRDRKFLWFSLIVGLVAGLVSLYIQRGTF